MHPTRAACEAGRVTRRSIGQTSNARMDSLFVCTIDRSCRRCAAAASNCLCGSVASVVYSSCSLSSVLSFYRSLSKKAVRGGLESRVSVHAVMRSVSSVVGLLASLARTDPRALARHALPSAPLASRKHRRSGRYPQLTPLAGPTRCCDIQTTAVSP